MRTSCWLVSWKRESGCWMELCLYFACALSPARGDSDLAVGQLSKVDSRTRSHQPGPVGSVRTDREQCKPCVRQSGDPKQMHAVAMGLELCRQPERPLNRIGESVGQLCLPKQMQWIPSRWWGDLSRSGLSLRPERLGRRAHPARSVSTGCRSWARWQWGDVRSI